MVSFFSRSASLDTLATKNNNNQLRAHVAPGNVLQYRVADVRHASEVDGLSDARGQGGEVHERHLVGAEAAGRWAGGWVGGGSACQANRRGLDTL